MTSVVTKECVSAFSCVNQGASLTPANGSSMRSIVFSIVALASCAQAPVVQQVQNPVPQPQFATAQSGYSSADSLLLLLNTPGTFDVLRKRIPYFVNLTEHGIIPAFPTNMTLDDLLNVPEARLTPELLAVINTELAAVERQN